MVRLLNERPLWEKVRDFFLTFITMILVFFGAIFKLEHPSRSYSRQETGNLKLKPNDIISYQRKKPNLDDNNTNEDEQPKKRMGGIKEQSDKKGGPDLGKCGGGG